MVSFKTEHKLKLDVFLDVKPETITYIYNTF